MNGVEQEGHDFGKFEGTIKYDNKDGTFTFEFDRDLANASIAEITELTEDQRVRSSPPFSLHGSLSRRSPAPIRAHVFHRQNSTS